MDEIRATARSPVGLSCACRLSDGMTLELELSDVSQRGCRALSPMVPLYVGQQVMLFPEGIDEVAGTVRHQEGDDFGIEFDREMPHTVFERLRLNGYVSDGISGEAAAPPPLPDSVAATPPTDEPAAQPHAEAAASEPGQTFASLTTLTPRRRGIRNSGHKPMVVL